MTILSIGIPTLTCCMDSLACPDLASSVHTYHTRYTTWSHRLLFLASMHAFVHSLTFCPATRSCEILSTSCLISPTPTMYSNPSTTSDSPSVLYFETSDFFLQRALVTGSFFWSVRNSLRDHPGNQLLLLVTELGTTETPPDLLSPTSISVPACSLAPFKPKLCECFSIVSLHVRGRCRRSSRPFGIR